MHKSLEGHFSRRPRQIVCRVTVGPIIEGRETVQIKDDGNTASRHHFIDDLIERGGEDYAAEGIAYTHIYFHAQDVPASVQEVL